VQFKKRNLCNEKNSYNELVRCSASSPLSFTLGKKKKMPLSQGELNTVWQKILGAAPDEFGAVDVSFLLPGAQVKAWIDVNSNQEQIQRVLVELDPITTYRDSDPPDDGPSGRYVRVKKEESWEPWEMLIASRQMEG
jgi:hypothetical protein